LHADGGIEPNGKEFFMWLVWAVCLGGMEGFGMYRVF
jgi:hypothetical protein